MAAIMPRLPDAAQNIFQQPQSQQFRSSNPYQTQYLNRQSSPPNSGSMLKQDSPPSPSGFPSRRRGNAPLFVPAVLRPNEFPSREPHEHRSHASVDLPSSAPRSSPGSGFINLAGIGAISISRFARRSSADSNSFVESELEKKLFPPVTAEPKRSHWKPDESATVCDHPSCTKRFGYFTRRHHCRSCGNIYCDPHSSYQISLDEDAQYNPRGQLSRACGICFDQFRVWSSTSSSKASSDTSSTRPSTRVTEAGSASTAPSSPVSTVPVPVHPYGGSKGSAPTQAPYMDVAQSVPRDWNWSTF
ncbi:hypothetical protein M0657_000600 [Pyricularia oryzae]|nr:hypothetical protein M0657_000600 [Pyricularia oryzae]